MGTLIPAIVSAIISLVSSTFSFLAKRSIGAVDKKMEDQAKRVDTLGEKVEKMSEVFTAEIRKVEKDLGDFKTQVGKDLGDFKTQVAKDYVPKSEWLRVSAEMNDRLKDTNDQLTVALTLLHEIKGRLNSDGK